VREDDLRGDPAGLRGLVHHEVGRRRIVHAERQAARAFGGRHRLALIGLRILHGGEGFRNELGERIGGHLKCVRALELGTAGHALQWLFGGYNRQFFIAGVIVKRKPAGMRNEGGLMRGDNIFAAVQTGVGEKQIGGAGAFLMKHVEIDFAIRFDQDAHAIAAVKHVIGADALGVAVLFDKQGVAQAHMPGLASGFGGAFVIARARIEEQSPGLAVRIVLGPREGKCSVEQGRCKR